MDYLIIDISANTFASFIFPQCTSLLSNCSVPSSSKHFRNNGAVVTGTSERFSKQYITAELDINNGTDVKHCISSHYHTEHAHLTK